MTKSPCYVALLLVAMPIGALADDVLPGLWELSVEATVDAAPGFAPGPVSVSQCFSKADARDPARLLAPVASPAAGDCSFIERTYVGSTFHFRMSCSGTLQLQTSGDVTFTPASFSGALRTSSSISGSVVEFQSVVKGHRVGDC